jgi:hypothetical protein
MHKKRWLFLVLVFVLALTTACGGGASAPVEEAPAVEEAAPPAAEEAPAQEEAPPAAKMETEFPLPEDVDASTVIDLGDGAINFQTTLTLPDAVSFYRFAFADLGYVERDINTSIEDTTFSMVFDGHASGIAIVIQGVDLGESVNINIRFEDI